MARGRPEQCVYCTSKDITFQQKVKMRKFLYYATVGWLTIDDEDDKEKIEREKSHICCCKCCRSYMKLKMTRQEITKLRDSMYVKEATLGDFRTIFGNVDFSELFEHIIILVQPKKNQIHIIFKICNIRAYLACKSVEDHFTVFFVGRIY